jgi:polyhydroxybutyrate depolymerase
MPGRLLPVLLGAFGAVLCLAADSCRADLAPGDYTFAVTQNGRSRNYIVHSPQTAPIAAKPVIINMHGGGGNARNQQSYSGMDVLADREGFLVVYPNGTGRFGDYLLTWNAGACCGSAQKDKVDDVGYLRAVVDDLAQRTSIDRNRVYATGLSNGAMMAYRLAAEAPDVVAAIAPVAGAMVLPSFNPKRPVPIMHIHSVDDPRALFAGGLGPAFPLTNIRVQHPAVEEVIGRWIEFDGCAKPPRVDPPLQGKGKTAQHTATRVTYAPCKEGVAVVLWKLTGSGHVWPGGRLDYLPRVLGPGTDVIDANEQMWKFLSRFRLAR